MRLCLREELCTLVLSCNSSLEAHLWKFLRGRSENSSECRRGRRAVAQASKYILVFAFDPLSLLYLTLLLLVHIHIHAWYCLCAHTCVEHGERLITSQLLV